MTSPGVSHPVGDHNQLALGAILHFLPEGSNFQEESLGEGNKLTAIGTGILISEPEGPLSSIPTPSSQHGKVTSPRSRQALETSLSGKLGGLQVTFSRWALGPQSCAEKPSAFESCHASSGALSLPLP